MHPTIDRIDALLRWPFSSIGSSPLWLALRIYLASVWLQFGLAKIRDGWLTANPVRDLLGAIAQGHTAAPLPAYRHLAATLLDVGADRMMSVAIPLLEVAVAIAFLAGVLLVPAAVGACLLNLNLVLSGIATLAFDGRIIALQLLLLAGWRVAGHLGVARLWRERTRGREGRLRVGRERAG